MWLELPKVIMLERDRSELCVRPYPNHPKGCPNFKKKLGCPPNIGLFRETYKTYTIYNIFPFGEHVRRMETKHPEWSERQCECCLYWQGTARKQLKDQIKLFGQEFSRFVLHMTPEALGVNVTATMEQVGIILEWPPKEYTYQVALASLI